jgi:hypothetical protein
MKYELARKGHTSIKRVAGAVRMVLGLTSKVKRPAPRPSVIRQSSFLD